MTETTSNAEVPPDDPPAYATAREAMERLKVRRQTLYSYVSRGLIRSVRQPGLKERLYLRDDLERMGARSLARAGHGAVAASAMNLGDPIVTTSVTEICGRGPRYRGHLAVDLASGGRSFEAISELLWTGRLPASDVPWAPAERGPSASIAIDEAFPAARLLDAFVMVTLRLGAMGDPEAPTANAARRLVHCLVECLALPRRGRTVTGDAEGPVVDAVLQALGLARDGLHRDAVGRILALLADHELAPGTLVARVAASGGAGLHHCIASAICASSGPQMAGLYSRVERFLSGAGSKEVLMQRAVRLQQQGQMVPGFSHQLYAKGDPRAHCLLAFARERLPAGTELAAALGFVEDMATTMELYPRHELASVAVCRAIGLPEGVPAALFALARVAGWVAHVEEQRLSDTLLRPRARFEPRP